MRIITNQELMEVAAAGINLPYVFNEAIDYGALGVLFNIVLNGVTAATIGNGFLMGAGVGVGCAIVHSVIYS
ncbi:hypothetical protein [Candidatus Berkiella aquae]|uniref:Uncharacterized protein n=1 Tax=Candidatus Berkiella aquae TaxID=295108 RepID=A0A0Q9YWG8_9GAMM|nr:hypothetical protein [Candidatus Berkiella aquae]MCS5709999.1 hypothetical protein [Candidatus Berkiella aquae]